MKTLRGLESCLLGATACMIPSPSWPPAPAVCPILQPSFVAAPPLQHPWARRAGDAAKPTVATIMGMSVLFIFSCFFGCSTTLLIRFAGQNHSRFLCHVVRLRSSVRWDLGNGFRGTVPPCLRIQRGAPLALVWQRVTPLR